MRGYFLGAIALGVVVACSDDEKAAVMAPCPDAGAPVDAGAVDAAPPIVRTPFDASTTLPANVHLLGGEDAEQMIGITSGPNPHVIYWAFKSDFEHILRAIPVAGGPPVDLDIAQSIAFGNSAAYVRGGAVAWFLAADANSITEDIRYWTPAVGKKIVPAKSRIFEFYSNTAGTRVAFSVEATDESTSYAVATADAPVANPVLASANLAASDASSCSNLFQFVGDTFVGAYCTGIDPAATQPRLVKVPSGGPPQVLVDNVLPADDFSSIRYGFTADTSAVFVADPGSPATTARLLVFDGTTLKATTKLTDFSNDARFSPDGAYLAMGGSKLTLTNVSMGTQVPVVVTAATVDGFTPESKTLVYTDGTLEGPLVKLDLTSPDPTPVKLADGAVRFLALTPSASHAIIENVDPKTSDTSITSVPLTGGAALPIGAATLAYGVHFTGDTLLVDTAFEPFGAGLAARVAFSTADATKGGAFAPALAAILDPSELSVNDFVGKRYIYRDIGTKPGIYALDLP